MTPCISDIIIRSWSERKIIEIPKTSFASEQSCAQVYERGGGYDFVQDLSQVEVGTNSTDTRFDAHRCQNHPKNGVVRFDIKRFTSVPTGLGPAWGDFKWKNVIWRWIQSRWIITKLSLYSPDILGSGSSQKTALEMIYHNGLRRGQPQAGRPEKVTK